MARSRNLKPGFFLNDKLGERDPLARLLFAGLWTIADREGRLEDRPRAIRAKVLPYDDCDVNALLDDLEVDGFVVRYKVGEGSYVQVVNWDKHQNPHVKEQASTIPAPCMSGASLEVAGLIPDSLNPLTDSLQEQGAKKNAPPPDGKPDFETNPMQTMGEPHDIKATTSGNGPAVDQSKNPMAEQPDVPTKASKVPSGARGTRLQAGTELPDEFRAYCRQERPDLDVAKTWADFHDFWISKAGKDATKTDWFATWRRWVRNTNSKTRGTTHDERKAFLDAVTGRNRRQSVDSIDDGRTIEADVPADFSHLIRA